MHKKEPSFFFFPFSQNSKCRNCDQLKARIQDQQEVYSQKIRELETCIRDLRAEKEVLERKVVSQRRPSEDFTDHVRQIVQRLEAERAHNERGEMEEMIREKENFFNMLKRFFKEHETMKYHAQVCLQDLTQVQQCFQVGLVPLRGRIVSKYELVDWTAIWTRRQNPC